MPELLSGGSASDNAGDNSAIGGGVCVGAGRMLTITFVSVSENTATGGEFGFGSGIGNVGGMLVLQCSSVIDNTADNSGGIANVDGTTTIINSTIGGNEAVNAVGVSLTSQARPTSRQHCN